VTSLVKRGLTSDVSGEGRCSGDVAGLRHVPWSGCRRVHRRPWFTRCSQSHLPRQGSSLSFMHVHNGWEKLVFKDLVTNYT